MSAVDIDRILRTWTGAKCTDATRREHDWTFAFGNVGGVGAECPWRILTGTGIALCASDDGQLFGRKEPVDAQADARSLLIGKAIVRATISPVIGDMRITFDDESVLEILNYSIGYESWQAAIIEGNRRTNIIGMGGGDVSIYQDSL